MKTEYVKSYFKGFVLNEQELRRLIDTSREHILKLENNEFEQTVEVKLRDGSLLTTNDVDEILRLENLGSKSVERLSIKFSPINGTDNWFINVFFQDGYRHEDEWKSTKLEIVGESRDWVFLAASALEERLKRIQRISWPFLLSRRWLMLVPMLIALAIVPFSGDWSVGDYSAKAVKELEREYSEGNISNAIEAFIYYEKTKQAFQPNLSRAILPVVITFAVPMLIYMFALFAFPRFIPSYHFYWGDYIAVFDKRRNAIRVIWVALVLAIIASLIAGFILRYI